MADDYAPAVMKAVDGGKMKWRPSIHMPREAARLFLKVLDVRVLWLVTLGGLALAALCIWCGYTGSLPWLAAMVGLPWTAHGVVCSFYLNMAKSDHSEGGITFEAAKAAGFKPEGSENSPGI